MTQSRGPLKDTVREDTLTIHLMLLSLVGIDIPDYVTVRSRERPGPLREDIIKR